MLIKPTTKCDIKYRLFDNSIELCSNLYTYTKQQLKEDFIYLKIDNEVRAFHKDILNEYNLLIKESVNWKHNPYNKFINELIQLNIQQRVSRVLNEV